MQELLHNVPMRETGPLSRGVAYEELRYSSESVHRIADLVGDLTLTTCRHIRIYKHQSSGKYQPSPVAHTASRA